jgi:protein-tyrosine-phosphatase
VLDDVGLIERTRSSGDGRRRYVRLLPEALHDVAPGRSLDAGPALFVCTANSARSQLAAALWTDLTGAPADSAGTEPAEQVHPGAVAAAARVGLDLSGAIPRTLEPRASLPPLVITVCDQAHEAAGDRSEWLHWSVSDPVPVGTRAAFDAAVRDLRRRIRSALDADRLAS